MYTDGLDLIQILNCKRIFTCLCTLQTNPSQFHQQYKFLPSPTILQIPLMSAIL